VVSSWSKRLALLAAGLSLQAVSAAPTLAASAPRFTSTVEFGDSLVDAGNYYITSGGTYPDAAGGFFEGRNTNGYDYTDLLSQQITGTATVASLAGGTNYAFGGARVLGGGYPDFAAQIAQYQQHLAATGGKLDSHTLVSITFGDNDVGAIDNGDLGGFGSREEALQAIAGSYAAGIQTLADMGARNILFTGFLYLDTKTSYELQDLLTADLAKLALPEGTHLYSYDILDFFKQAADPTKLGLPAGLDTVTPCRAAGAQPDCSHYLFFDGDHPTAAAHQAILNDIEHKFGLRDTAPSAVPEPSAWGLLLAGFALLGWRMRRRQAGLRAPALATN
jgi:phospholipase/lecithinase/hemolysin